MTEETKPENVITLGGKDHKIVPLTLGVLKELGIGAAKQRHGAELQKSKENDWAKSEAEWYDGTYHVLGAALGMKTEELLKLEKVQLGELADAVNKIYMITGLVTLKAKKPGEVKGEPTG